MVPQTLLLRTVDFQVQSPAECGTSTADCPLLLVEWTPASPTLRGKITAGGTLLPHRTPNGCEAVYGRHPRPSLLLAAPYTPHTPYTLSPRTPPLLVASARLPPIGRDQVVSHPRLRYRLAIWHFGNLAISSNRRLHNEGISLVAETVGWLGDVNQIPGTGDLHPCRRRDGEAVMWRRASLSWNSGIPENRKLELVKLTRCSPARFFLL
jgi:hypothetical protein